MDAIIGEQYLPMIASFHYPDHEPVFGNGWNSGWCCCNDVHEIFIAMAEVVLTCAYVIERTNGQLVTWNCRATRDDTGAISIQLAEDIVSRVHLNLQQPHRSMRNSPTPLSSASGLKACNGSGLEECRNSSVSGELMDADKSFPSYRTSLSRPANPGTRGGDHCHWSSTSGANPQIVLRMISAKDPDALAK